MKTVNEIKVVLFEVLSGDGKVMSITTLNKDTDIVKRFTVVYGDKLLNTVELILVNNDLAEIKGVIRVYRVMKIVDLLGGK